MTTLALAILAVGTLYCIASFGVRDGVIMYIPPIAAIACVLSALL